MTKVFETREGVALFFDEENYDYSSDNMPAIEKALKEDMSNYKVDPQGAAMAHNLMAIMQNMDAVKEMVCNHRGWGPDYITSVTIENHRVEF